MIYSYPVVPAIVFVSLFFLHLGCGYPNYNLVEVNNPFFYNKRDCSACSTIQEFIKPGQTKDLIAELPVKSLSGDKDENLVLNFLSYTQGLKNKKEKTEFWQYPEETINKGGDCEDKTFLLLSMLIQAGIKDVKGVKGRYLGGGHMWVEYKNYILDPSHKRPKMIPARKSIGYTPYFKFDQNGIYYCEKQH